MKYAIRLVIAAVIITSCSPSAPIPIKSAEAQEATPPAEEVTISRESEQRFATVLLLINQLCTDENGINKACRKSVIKCYGDIWQPTPKILGCVDDWESKPQP